MRAEISIVQLKQRVAFTDLVTDCDKDFCDESGGWRADTHVFVGRFDDAGGGYGGLKG